MGAVTSKKPENGEQRYVLNNFQQIFVKTNKLRETLQNVQFPLLVLDMEFFNRSHNINQIKSENCNLSNGQVYVYLLQGAAYPNLSSLLTQNPRAAIQNLTLERHFNNRDYSFKKEQRKLINQFLEILEKRKIKTIVLAGASNDQRIINSWIHSQGNEQLKKIEFWDVYPTLEQTMAFTNFTSQGELFGNAKNLRKGFHGEKSLMLPSLKKFFDYMQQQFPNFSYNDNLDIYRLSHQILEFFCQEKMSIKEYELGKAALAQAKEHCFNDVYKIIILLQYWWSLILKEGKKK